MAAKEPPEPLEINHICGASRLKRQQQEDGYPSVATMVGNALAAAGRFVASGMQTVAPEEFERRHAICEACDQFVAAEDRCRACGCWLAIKPWGARESCPIGKW
jgi:hypothetical protein